jgi:hypothetical protein
VLINLWDDFVLASRNGIGGKSKNDNINVGSGVNRGNLMSILDIIPVGITECVVKRWY